MEKWIQARYEGDNQWSCLPRSATSLPNEYETSYLSREYQPLQKAESTDNSRELGRGHSLSGQYARRASCPEVGPQPLQPTSSGQRADIERYARDESGRLYQVDSF